MKFSQATLLVCISLFVTPIWAVTATLSFVKSKPEFLGDQVEKLFPVIEESLKDTSLKVVIEEFTGNLKPRQQAYIVAKVRVLMIFQELVAKGLHPGRITYKIRSTADAKGVVAVYTESSQNTLPLLETLKATSSDGKGGTSEFKFFFDTASAEHLALDENEFRLFLMSVGQPGRDAVLIEGYTDTKGNAEYNKYLSHLRALHVFEFLVRAGLPSYRFLTKGMGADGENQGKNTSAEVQAAKRRVVVRWVEDAGIAAHAKSIETPPPAEEKQPVEEEFKEETDAQWSLMVFAGLLIPQGDLGERAKSSPHLGLGFYRSFDWTEKLKSRTGLSLSGVSKHGPRQDDRSGTLNIQLIALQSEAVFALGSYNPFLIFGVTLCQWNGSILQPSTELENSSKKSDLGIRFGVGLDFATWNSVTFSPEILLDRVAGTFGESLLNIVFSARYKL